MLHQRDATARALTRASPRLPREWRGHAELPLGAGGSALLIALASAALTGHSGRVRRILRNVLFGFFGVAAFFGFALAIPNGPDCTAQLPVPEICKHATSANPMGLALLAFAAVALAAAIALGSHSFRRRRHS